MTVLINVDVPELEPGIAFYTDVFGLAVGRRFGAGAVELTGWPVPLFLLRRHWTPVHLDIIVEEIESALSRAWPQAPWSA